VSDDILVFDDVTVRYRGSSSDALSRCSFEIHAGEKVALVGLNGSGKTTLLKACAGLIAYDGRIHLNGLPVEKRNLPAIRQAIGYLFSTPDDQLLMPRVVDDVAIALRGEQGDKKARMDRARTMLESLGVRDLADRSPYELSHGQKQRVALAGALVAEPPLLLLDEPSSCLDPPARMQLARILRCLPSAHVLATHDLAFARRCCTAYILLDGARRVTRGSDFDKIASAWEIQEDISCDLASSG
jgi:cobalt/nickel transport system ATP-binding protein